jgi:leader peptidase (prepilin peptidase)/N-methyltransferase
MGCAWPRGGSRTEVSMNLWHYLQGEPAAFVWVVGIFGLFVGSFLNVVIYRLPIMLERRWQAQCAELLRSKLDETSAAKTQARFNLIVPSSQCPCCGHKIRPWENIPVLSYLVLRGRCSSCKTRIPLSYPAVEVLAAVLSAVVAWHFGWGWQALAALLLTWALLALSAIDLIQQLLPDDITLPFLWIGLLLSLFSVFVDPRASILGAVVGYLSLWAVYMLFKQVTGKEGMGYGDFKLLAMLGAWLGWYTLPLIILLSSLVGAVIGVTLVLVRRHDKNVPIPFGPYLATAGWVAMLWGEDIVGAYLALW